MNSLRLKNPTFKNIKVGVLLSKKKTSKKNKFNDENEYNKKIIKWIIIIDMELFLI